MFSIVTILLLFLNLIVYLHAYKFTHFTDPAEVKGKNPNKSGIIQKLQTILLGIDNPRPENLCKPSMPYETILLNSNVQLESWLLRADSSIGTVILFHGYCGEKSEMQSKAEVFLNMKYNCLLVDFMGSGGSAGNQTTIGYYEALNVKSAFDYVKNLGEENIILFGTSMGAAAIMKAQKDYQLNARSIIVECPFGTMMQTVTARFNSMHIPSFPMANLLVFWGGLINGFNAFTHNPVEYASKIKTPTLLLYGQKDPKVSQNEIDEIYGNLQGVKILQTYPRAGHESYLIRYKDKWTTDVQSFLNGNHLN